jgi:AcrR family transcriptional regulator
VGTFYTHFKSKEALLREALVGSLDARHAELKQALHGADIETLVRAYLSPEHRDAAGTGCPVAALASEVARHPRATRHTFASHNAPALDALSAWLSARQGKEVGRADAAALLGLLAGTLQIARATPDRAESDAILEAGVRAAIRLAE